MGEGRALPARSSPRAFSRFRFVDKMSANAADEPVAPTDSVPDGDVTMSPPPASVGRRSVSAEPTQRVRSRSRSLASSRRSPSSDSTQRGRSPPQADRVAERVELVEAKTQIRDLEIDKDDLEAKLATAKTDLGDVRLQLGKALDVIEELRTEASRLRKERGEYRAQKNQYESENKNLRASVTSLTKVVSGDSEGRSTRESRKRDRSFDRHSGREARTPDVDPQGAVDQWDEEPGEYSYGEGEAQGASRLPATSNHALNVSSDPYTPDPYTSQYAQGAYPGHTSASQHPTSTQWQSNHGYNTYSQQPAQPPAHYGQFGPTEPDLAPVVYLPDPLDCRESSYGYWRVNASLRTLAKYGIIVRANGEVERNTERSLMTRRTCLITGHEANYVYGRIVLERGDAYARHLADRGGAVPYEQISVARMSVGSFDAPLGPVMEHLRLSGITVQQLNDEVLGAKGALDYLIKTNDRTVPDYIKSAAATLIAQARPGQAMPDDWVPPRHRKGTEFFLATQQRAGSSTTSQNEFGQRGRGRGNSLRGNRGNSNRGTHGGTGIRRGAAIQAGRGPAIMTPQFR